MDLLFEHSPQNETLGAYQVRICGNVLRSGQGRCAKVMLCEHVNVIVTCYYKYYESNK